MNYGIHSLYMTAYSAYTCRYHWAWDIMESGPHYHTPLPCHSACGE